MLNKKPSVWEGLTYSVCGRSAVTTYKVGWNICTLGILFCYHTAKINTKREQYKVFLSNLLIFKRKVRFRTASSLKGF